MKLIKFFIFVFFIFILVKPIYATSEYVYFCDDSDGKNFYVAGNCNSTSGYPGTDSCQTGLAREYYCSSEETCWFEDYPCQFGCNEEMTACRSTEESPTPPANPISYSYTITYGDKKIAVRDDTPGCCVNANSNLYACQEVTQAVQCCPHTTNTGICLQQWFYPSYAIDKCADMMASNFPGKAWCETSCCCDDGVASEDVERLKCRGYGKNWLYPGTFESCTNEECEDEVTPGLIGGQGCCINPNSFQVCETTEESLCCNQGGEYDTGIGPSSQEECADNYHPDWLCRQEPLCSQGCCCKAYNPEYSEDVNIIHGGGFAAECVGDDKRWFPTLCSYSACVENFEELIQVDSSDSSFDKELLEFLEENPNIPIADSCGPEGCSEGLECMVNDLVSPHISRCCPKDTCATETGCTSGDLHIETIGDRDFACLNGKWQGFTFTQRDIVHDCTQQGGTCRGNFITNFLGLIFGQSANCRLGLEVSVGRCNSYDYKRCCLER